jgi:hypothetical protein
LDGARVTQLCQYLEALHDKKMANGQHATLLLGAYIKQNAKDKINSFIEKIGDIENFNIEQAIKVRSDMIFNSYNLGATFDRIFKISSQTCTSTSFI